MAPDPTTFDRVFKFVILGDKSKWKDCLLKENNAVVLVFSTTDVCSFEYTLELYNEIQNTTEKMPVVFIENKMDIVESSQMEKEIVEGEIRKKHKRLYRVSALKEFNVMHPFAYLIEKLTRQKKDHNANERTQYSSITSSTTSSPSTTVEATAEPVPAANATTHSFHKKDKCIII